ncbi:xanthine dehydrogenase accessory protein XdhC [Rouxiella chamberiensis]|uniref:Xanthine dehydrogenase accessory protein XdhC n=1 Tax=Rouxiella chamberiensis TaxID=1513468 RepID=A0ABY7HSE0_9GAMM|nr:xanthine dehydrogenase accessory protein XdhC [Rouxiella chamberiensis]WAT02330.1 xanthine dehydrogenase accessory protein XdhC [Rouxiella chamberiensis]
MRTDDWITQLNQLQERRESCVMITLVEHQGSTPRNSGCKMLVTAAGQYFTLGGGNLEFQAIAIAREMLEQHHAQSRLERFNLGARLGQCCGGVATVLFEPLCQSQPQVVVYGAGHVGRALVAILATLPCRITWVDARASEFPAHVDPQITCVIDEEPEATVQQMPADSYFIVLTHDHQLDLALSEKILRRNDFRYFGLIGSETKRKRFDYRLAGKGISEACLRKMRCPVGLPDVKGKLPAEIAVAIAGEVIAAYQRT